MNYTMVKQFSNAAIDNFFRFFFKIVDFGKILYEALWAFFDIWIAFYLIFYNALMYIYYLLLFLIDRGSIESRYTVLFWKKAPKGVSRTPGVTLSKEPNPIPAMYRTTVKKTSEAASATAETVSRAATAASETVDVVFSSSSRGKKPFLKTTGEAIVNFFSSLKKALFLPFEVIANFFNNRMKPVREEEKTTEQKSKSLIDEYLKEYERKKK
jgi:hypothetical protein